MAETAGLLGDAEVAGVDELDELGGLVVEEDGRFGRVGGALPELGVERGDVGLAHREAGGGIAAVAVDTAEDDVGGSVHVLDTLVALDTAGGFAMGLGAGLVDFVGGFGRRTDGRVVGRQRGGGRAGDDFGGGARGVDGGAGAGEDGEGGEGDAPGGGGEEGPAKDVSGIEAHVLSK